VIIYEFAILFILCFTGYKMLETTAGKVEGLSLLFACVLTGGLGGVLYCLRGVYLNYSVYNKWTSQLIPWYLIRPIVSLICGGISFVFLKAGLLVLEAQKESDATNLGFYALSFIAGLNVDKFLSRVEDLAQATWGIEKSRTSQRDKNNPLTGGEQHRD
jgi:hypothetical protein